MVIVAPNIYQDILQISNILRLISNYRSWLSWGVMHLSPINLASKCTPLIHISNSQKIVPKIISFRKILHFVHYFLRMFANIPMVDEVIDESRPSTQENGREIAIAPVPIFPTCIETDILPRIYKSKFESSGGGAANLTRSCSRKQK